ncbi:hypothetical protein FSS13T_18390 [Flavobacterium saliperosum S13]|uniref:Uncharacterized protein n=1 Tax=Flavobacterium saliperosum S13 TaxID=1341155 RepID=A0ABN0QG87_9FLAO|nr:hypothetical protein FSS13T_18390 [Flavobacterium saliperosum S13]
MLTNPVSNVGIVAETALEIPFSDSPSNELAFDITSGVIYPFKRSTKFEDIRILFIITSKLDYYNNKNCS